MTPNGKKQKTEEFELDDEQSGDEMEKANEIDASDAPWWAKKQFQMMDAMMKKMTALGEMQTEIKVTRTELDHVKLQTGLAQNSAEEALERVNNAEDRRKAIEDEFVCRDEIMKMIGKASTTTQMATYRTNFQTQQSTQSKAPNVQEDKFSRTFVVGGFEPDTPNKEVVKFLNENLLNDATNVDEC